MGISQLARGPWSCQNPAFESKDTNRRSKNVPFLGDTTIRGGHIDFPLAISILVVFEFDADCVV
jgi:hypothetical protein